MTQKQPESTHYTFRTQNDTNREVRQPLLPQIVEENEQDEKLKAIETKLDYQDHPQNLKTEEERIFDEQKAFSFYADNEGLVAMKKIIFKNTDIVVDIPDSEINSLKARDGLFLKDEEYDPGNLFRFEQRLIKNALDSKSQNESALSKVFDNCGCVILDTLDKDLKHTRPVDFSQSENIYINLLNLNSVSSQRENISKNEYFRLDLTLGTIKFKIHEAMTEEEIIETKLIDLYYLYQRRIINKRYGYFKRILDTTNQSINAIQDFLSDYSEQDEKYYFQMEKLDNLKKYVLSVERKMNLERDELDAICMKINDYWTDINGLRNTNNFSSSKIYFDIRDVAQDDFFYDETGCTKIIKMSKSQISSKTKQGIELPYAETARRASVTNYHYYFRVCLNGSTVMETQWFNLSYPDYTIAVKEKVQLNLFGFPDRLEIQLVTTFGRVVASSRLKIPGEGKKELSGTEVVNQESLFMENANKTFTETDNPLLLKYWKEEFYNKHNLGVIQSRLEWVDSTHIKLPIVNTAPKKMKETPIHGWDYNDPFVIDEMMDKGKSIHDHIDVNKMTKMHSEFQEVDKEGKVKYFSRNKVPYRYRMLELRQKNKIEIPIPLLAKDFQKDPKLEKRLELQEGDDSLNVDYILFDNQFKKDVKNENLRERLLTIKHAMQSRHINIKAIEVYTINDVLRNQYQLSDSNMWTNLKSFVLTHKRPLLPVKENNDLNELSVVNGIKIKLQLSNAVRLPSLGFTSSAEYAMMLINQQFDYGHFNKNNIMGGGMNTMNLGMNLGMSMNMNMNMNMGFGNSMNNNFSNTGMGSNFGNTQQGGFNQGQQGGFNQGQQGGFNNTQQGGDQNQQGGFNNTQNQGFNNTQNSSSSQNMMGNMFRQNMGNTMMSNMNTMNIGRPMGMQSEMPGASPLMKTYAELSFISNKGEIELKITDQAMGENPNYNGNFEFILKKYAEEELLNACAYVRINLYVLHEKKTPISREHNTYTVTYKNSWIGSTTFPLKALVQAPPEIDGQIAIRRPAMKLESIKAYNNSMGRETPMDMFSYSYLNALFSFPLSYKLPKFKNDVFNNINQREGQILIEFLKKKLFYLDTNYGQVLRYRVMGDNLDGQCVFLSKFINKRGMPIPPEFEVYNKRSLCTFDDPTLGSKFWFTIYEKLAWYVSLFPSESEYFTKDMSMVSDIYFTNQEMLDVGIFDCKNHAVMLANYFNKIDSTLCPDASSYLLYCRTLTEGYTVYVLRKNNLDAQNKDAQHVEVWNPLTGECYVVNKKLEQLDRIFYKVNVFRNEEESNPNLVNFDQWTPILEVYQLVSFDNIYFNVGTRNIREINFDFDDAYQWNRLFNNEYEKKMFGFDIDKNEFPNDHIILNSLEYFAAQEDFDRNISIETKNAIETRMTAVRLGKDDKDGTEAEEKLYDDKGNYNPEFFRRLDRPKSSTNFAPLEIHAECERFLEWLEEYHSCYRHGNNNYPLSRVKNVFDMNENLESNSETTIYRIGYAMNMEMVSRSSMLLKFIENKNPGCELYGFPIHIKTLDLDSIWTRVKETKIWEHGGDDTQFIVATFSKTYSSTNTSLWVFLGCIVRNAL